MQSGLKNERIFSTPHQNLNKYFLFYFNMLYSELVKYWNDTMAYKGDN